MELAGSSHTAASRRVIAHSAAPTGLRLKPLRYSSDAYVLAGLSDLRSSQARGKRRDWPPEVKVSIVGESYSGQESISAVARRHAMCLSQLFTWRRELRKQMQAQGLALPAPSSKKSELLLTNRSTRHRLLSCLESS
ncbi:transposase [Novosphingobium chloroacetimidivorans]|uniref:transposase n=1 Tax=Novosphingobium chloroacetimidivorans TaxID=1428314 RepID=UPI0035E43226